MKIGLEWNEKTGIQSNWKSAKPRSFTELQRLFYSLIEKGVLITDIYLGIEY